MENKNKKRILIGILIVLILMNLAALGTFGFKKYYGHRPNENRWNKDDDKQKDPHDRVKMFIKRKLDLKEDQFKKYCDLKDLNSKNSNNIWVHISQLRASTTLELTSEKPDTIKLMQIADSLGFYHKKMLLEMNHHFLSVKKILDPAQIVTYNEMLRNIDKGGWNNRDNRDRDNRDNKGRTRDTCDKRN